MTPPPDPELLAPAEPVPAARPELAARLVRNTGVLAVSNLVVRALGMVLMVMLARYLGAEGYGTYQRSEAFVFLFSILANLGLDMILARDVARRDPRSAELTSGTVVLKVILGTATCALILAVAQMRGYHGDFLWGIRAYAVVLLLNSLGYAVDAVFQGRENMVYIAVANIANQLVILALGAAGILLGKDLRWLLGSLIVSYALRLAISLALLARLRLGWRRPTRSTLVYLLRESLPVAFAASFVVVYQQVDAVMLGEMKGDVQVGWYKAGAKFLLLFTVLRDSFMVALYPVFSSVARTDRPRLGGLVTRAVRYQAVVSLYFVVCFVFLSRLAPRLLGAEFRNSAAVLPIMACILLPQVLSITAGRALVASGHQSWLLVSTGLSLVVNVSANLLLIPRYGFMGAAVAGVTSETVVAALNFLFVQRLVAPTRIWAALAKPVLAAVLAGVSLYYLRALPLTVAFPLAAVVYGAALLLLRTFAASELRQFRQLAGAAMARLMGRRVSLPRLGTWLGEREP